MSKAFSQALSELTLDVSRKVELNLIINFDDVTPAGHERDTYLYDITFSVNAGMKSPGLLRFLSLCETCFLRFYSIVSLIGLENVSLLLCLACLVPMNHCFWPLFLVTDILPHWLIISSATAYCTNPRQRAQLGNVCAGFEAQRQDDTHTIEEILFEASFVHCIR